MVLLVKLKQSALFTDEQIYLKNGRKKTKTHFTPRTIIGFRWKWEYFCMSHCQWLDNLHFIQRALPPLLCIWFHLQVTATENFMNLSHHTVIHMYGFVGCRLYPLNALVYSSISEKLQATNYKHTLLVLILSALFNYLCHSSIHPVCPTVNHVVSINPS